MGDEPTVKQVYALAAALCAGAGLPFPKTREAASALIERLRLDIGHPAPRLEDTRPRPRRRRRGRRSPAGASFVAKELADEMS
jgi:hypothetical protein